MKYTLALLTLLLSSLLQAQEFYDYKDIIQGDEPERKILYGAYGSLGAGSDALFLELGPELFYKPIQPIHLGLGASLLYLGREITVTGQSYRTESLSWGGRAFTRFKVYKPVHIRIEYEQMNVEYLEPVPGAEFTRIWKEGLHLGIEFFKDEFIGESSFFGFYYNVLFEDDISPQFSAISFRGGVYF